MAGNVGNMLHLWSFLCPVMILAVGLGCAWTRRRMTTLILVNGATFVALHLSLRPNGPSGTFADIGAVAVYTLGAMAFYELDQARRGRR